MPDRSTDLNSKPLEKLAQAILLLKSKDDAKRFLRDLLTAQEIVEFSKRWEAACMLSEEQSYSRIKETTGLSSATIARISHWLTAGCGGYHKTIQRFRKIHHRA